MIRLIRVNLLVASALVGGFSWALAQEASVNRTLPPTPVDQKDHSLDEKNKESSIPTQGGAAQGSKLNDVNVAVSPVFSWRGTQFDMGDQALARARFEKFLNSPESDLPQAIEYNAVLREISDILAGKGGSNDQQRIIRAWRMLYKAAEYEVDNRISETLASRIVTCWQANQKISEILSENQQLERDRERHERAIRVEEAAKQRSSETPRPNKDKENTNQAFQQPTISAPSISASAPSAKRLMEAEVRMKANEATSVLSKQTLKIEFQALILQFFAQRRFQHVNIAADFYRYIFAGEEQTLQGVNGLRSGISGIDTKITTTALQSLTNEALRDVNSGISVVDYHLGLGELQAATERLQEAYMLGEFTPAIQTFPRNKKQQITEFVRLSNQLLAALEVRDFEQASTFLDKISEIAKDFNPIKPRALIEGAKQVSNLTLKRALLAAQSGDMKATQELIQESLQAWPKNPEIEKVTDSLFSKVDLKNSLTADFDRLINQKDFRSIFDNRFRLGTALATDETRNQQLVDVMKRMEKVEIAMAQAKELERAANKFGAWEILERTYREYPEDVELNRMRADYALEALEYASALSAAKKAEQRNDFGTSMNLYLKAGEIYPAGILTREGLDTVARKYFEHTQNTDKLN